MKLNLNVPLVQPSEMVKVREEAQDAAVKIWRTICHYYGSEIPEIRMPKTTGESMQMVTGFFERYGWSVSSFYMGGETVFRVNTRTQENKISYPEQTSFYIDLKVNVIGPDELSCMIAEAQEVASEIWNYIQDQDDPVSEHTVTFKKRVSQQAINIVEAYYANHGWNIRTTLYGDSSTEFKVSPVLKDAAETELPEA